MGQRYFLIALGEGWDYLSSLGRFMFEGSVELEGSVRLVSAPVSKFKSDAAGIIAAREVPSSWSIVMKQHRARISYFKRRCTNRRVDSFIFTVVRLASASLSSRTALALLSPGLCASISMLRNDRCQKKSGILTILAINTCHP